MPPVLADLEPQGPAALAGLRAGYRIVAFNDQPVSDWMALVEWVRARPGQTVAVRFQRDGLACLRDVGGHARWRNIVACRASQIGKYSHDPSKWAYNCRALDCGPDGGT